jgi:hypothetical protein
MRKRRLDGVAFFVGCVKRTGLDGVLHPLNII